VQRAIADSELAPLATAKRPLAYVAAALAAGAVLGVLLHWVFTDRAPDGTGRAPASPPAESAKAVPAKPEQPVVAAAPRPAEKPVVAPKPRALPASGGQAASAPPLAKAPPAVPEKPSTPSPVHDSSAPASTKADDPSTSTSASPAKPVVSAPLMARVESQGVPARLLPEQIERMEAYDTRGMRLLGERIAATREALQTAPDDAVCIELYLTLNTDPARIERFLIRARGLATLDEMYVIPLTRSSPTRVWVVYGKFATRAAAEEAARRLPAVYHKDFGLALRDFAALRRPI